MFSPRHLKVVGQVNKTNVERSRTVGFHFWNIPSDKIRVLENRIVFAGVMDVASVAVTIKGWYERGPCGDDSVF